MDSTELAQVLASLGDNGIRAFVVYQVLDFLEVITFFSLSAWAIRSAWRMYKKHEWGE